MPHNITHPFTGATGQSCSYTAQFLSKHGDAAKNLGMTEAQYEKHLVDGHWGVVSGKMSTGTLPDGQVLFRMKSQFNDGEFTASWNKAKKTIDVMDHKYRTKTSWPYVEFEDMWMNGGFDLSLPGVPGPAVSSASKAVGALTDQDAAALFVKVKDDFAKLQGLSIKGANAALDAEVYASIGAQSGYSAAELAAKVERYKADGNKLSALKKKVLSGKVKVKEFETAVLEGAAKTEVQAVVENNVISPSAKEGLKKTASQFNDEAADYTMNGHKVGSVKPSKPLEEWEQVMLGTTDAGYDVLLVGEYGEIEVFFGNTKTQAEALIKQHAKLPHFKTPMESVHTSASKAAAEDAVADMVAKQEAKAFVYTDEEVVKAYIKAKDELAASVDNPWTLYTQKNDEFEAAISHLMEKSYGVDLTNAQIKQQVANYLGDGNKVSVLKKKMAKSGEYKPKAPSLKKTKAEKLASTPPTNSAATAAEQVDDFAHYGYNPTGTSTTVLTEDGSKGLFTQLKHEVAGYKSDAQNFESFLKGVKSMENAGYDNLSALDIIRSYDVSKAKQLGIPNEFFYEKKMANWASSPDGKAYILKKKTAEELLANLPPLPASSAGFTNTSIDDARRIQRSMGSWNAEQKSALTRYTASSSEMNGRLRRAVDLSGGGDTTVGFINSAQAGMHPTTEKMLARRGCDFRQFGVGSVQDAMGMIGKTVTDKGFLSTSVGQSAAFGGELLLEIEVAPGTYAAFVKDISRYGHENELLLAHGTKFEILGVTPGANYNPTIMRIRTVPGSHGSRLARSSSSSSPW